MDFWNDDNSTTACDICGSDNGDNIGQGSVNTSTGMHSFYLCPACAQAEAKRIEAIIIEDQHRQDVAISMHMTMD